MRAQTLSLIFLLALLWGCDLKTPSSSPVSLPAEEILSDLPFDSDDVSAMAWHPNGQRLAVAEREGASNQLQALTPANSRPQALKLRLQSLRRFAAIAGRRIVSENEAGQLQVWSIENQERENLLAEEIHGGLWSVSASGEDLVYVPQPASAFDPLQVRHLSRAHGEEAVIADSLRSVLAVSVLPNGEGVWVAYSVRDSSATRFKIALFSLPAKQARSTIENVNSFIRMVPSPDGRQLAYTRYANNKYEVMIYDVQRGLIDSVLAVHPPASDLVWLNEEPWLVMFEESGRVELRAYHLQQHFSVVLAQDLPFARSTLFRGGALLSAFADTLLFLTASPERVSVFDRRDYSFEPWWEATDTSTITSMAWTSDGQKIFLHVRLPSGKSVVQLGVQNDWQSYPQNFGYLDAALWPEEQHILGVFGGNSRDFVKTDLFSSGVEVVWRSKTNVEALRVHPEGRFAAVIDWFYDEHSSAGARRLRVLDLISKAVLDSVLLPGNAAFGFEWLQTPQHLAGIWKARRETDDPFYDYEYDYYYVALDERRLLPIFRYNETAFCAYPNSERVSILVGNTLRTLQLQSKLP